MPRFSSLLTFNIGGLLVQCDDEHHMLTISGRVPLLSPMEYIFTRELLIWHHEWQDGRREERYASISALLERTGTKNLPSLYRVASNARCKLKRCGLELECRWGQGYYVVSEA